MGALSMRRPAVAVALVLAIAAATGCGGHPNSARRAPTTTTTTTTAPTAPPTPPLRPRPRPTVATPTTKAPRIIPLLPPTTVARPFVPAPIVIAPVTPNISAATAKIVGAYPAKSYVTSDVVVSGSSRYLAVGHDVGALSSLVDVYVLAGAAFVDVGAGLGAGRNLDPVDPTTIRTADITGASVPDFLVPLAAGGHDNGVLVSFATGFWHLIGPSERTGAAASPELVQPTIRGNQITQSVNDCNPNCARGTYSVTTYVYSPALDALVAVGPTIRSPTP